MNFKYLVEKYLWPLLFSYGFKMNSDIYGIVEFETEELIIVVSYDYNSSYEVSMTLLFRKNGQFYDYAELNEYFYGIKNDFVAIQTKDEKPLTLWLTSIERLLKENLEEILDNPEKTNNDLEGIKARQINEFNQRKDLEWLTENVDKYWDNKDYLGLVKLLGDYTGELHGSVKKKYEYALKVVLQ